MSRLRLRPAHRLAAALALAALVGGCSDGTSPRARDEPTSATPSATGAAPAPSTPSAAGNAVRLRTETVVDGLDTVWSLAFDSTGALWWTERGGRLTRLGGTPRRISGVEETGEAGLMGLAFDAQDRPHVMFTGDDDNRVVRLDGDRQTVLVDDIPKGGIHDGGRIAFGPDGRLFVSTGDTGDTSLPQRSGSLAGKVLVVGDGSATVFSKGHRNVQGLCFAPDGRLFATEHGPDRGDEIAVITSGGNGGWPDSVGDGVRAYTPTIAPAGCAWYDAAAIPQWRGSLLFTTLKQRDLRRLSFAADGSVSDEEVLYDGEFGRLRDVAVGPDGSVYLATSNRDGRGDGRADKVIRISPA